MGILDDAIREHLDLKRKHGARDADLREIEDEAFGSTDRPDPFAANELFNEVSSTGGGEAERGGAPSNAADLGGLDVGDEEPTRLVESEAFKPPEAPPEEARPEATSEPISPPEGLRPSEPVSPPEGLRQPEPISPPEGLDQAEPISPPDGIDQIPGQVEIPGQDEIPGQERLDEPLEDFRPAREIEPEPEPPSPSESLEDLIAEEEPFPEDTAAPPAVPADDVVEPSAPPAPEAPPEPDEEPAEPEPGEEPADEEPAPEPESSVPDPPPPPPPSGPEPPGRARGRVDVPTQEHPPPGQTGGLPPVPGPEPDLEPEPLEPTGEEPLPDPFAEEDASGESGGPALYDFETDEESLVSPEPAPADDDFEALGPADEEGPLLEDEEPPAEEPGTAVRPALEDEEAYEGGELESEETYEEEGEEGLWFEKGPPQDFDFEDDK